MIDSEKGWKLNMAKSIASVKIDFATFAESKSGRLAMVEMKRNFKIFMKEARLLKTET